LISFHVGIKSFIHPIKFEGISLTLSTISENVGKPSPSSPNKFDILVLRDAIPDFIDSNGDFITFIVDVIIDLIISRKLMSGIILITVFFNQINPFFIDSNGDFITFIVDVIIDLIISRKLISGIILITVFFNQINPFFIV
jgi:hypothetical protein